jgi:hypothetical protein
VLFDGLNVMRFSDTTPASGQISVGEDMKSTLVRSALIAVVLTAFAASAQANTITPSLTFFGPGIGAAYDAKVSGSELHAGDGFTIFDIGLFNGVVIAPVDWTFSVTNVGSPFGPTTGDHGGDANIHFTYTGASVEYATSFTYTGFAVGSTSLTLAVDTWVSRDHNIGTVGSIDGSVSTPSGAGQDILVPASVPDGGSTMALLGLAMLGVGAVRRRLVG